MMIEDGRLYSTRRQGKNRSLSGLYPNPKTRIRTRRFDLQHVDNLAAHPYPVMSLPAVEVPLSGQETRHSREFGREGIRGITNCFNHSG